MRFCFVEKKAAQAAAHLIQRHGGRLYYIHLIKLLYLADRESLLRTGCPITGDRMVSMNRGPVLSRVYSLISDDSEQTDGSWRTYISDPRDFQVSLAIASPDTDELSRFEVALLDEIDGQFGTWDRFKLCDWMHENLPEWQDPRGGMLPIKPESILQAGGKSGDEISRAREDAEELYFIDSQRGLAG